MLDKVAAIAEKELKIILRDPVGVFMLFVLPAVFILVLSVALQGAFATTHDKERFGVLVVDEDDGVIGRKLVDALNATRRFEVVTEIGGKRLTETDARRLLERGEYRLAVKVPRHADEALLFERDETVRIFTDPVLSSEVALTMKNAVVGFVDVMIVQSLLVRDEKTREAMGRIAGLASEAYRNATAVSSAEPEPFDDAIQTQSANYARDRGLLVAQSYVAKTGREVFPNEVQQNVPGWTVFALFWIAQMLAFNLVTERESGIYKRILVAPVGLPQYLLGKTAPFLVVNLVQAACMFSIGVYVLPLIGCARLSITNVGGLALVTLAISLVAIGFGLFMAAISRSSVMVASASAAVLIILCVVGGVMVPKFVMPAFLQKMSLFVPQGWAVECYQDILVRNLDTAEILPGIGVLLLFALGFLIFGVARLSALARAD